MASSTIFAYFFGKRQDNVAVDHATSASTSPHVFDTPPFAVATTDRAARQAYATYSVRMNLQVDDSQRVKAEREINGIIRAATRDQIPDPEYYSAIAGRCLITTPQSLWVRVPCAKEDEITSKIQSLRSVLDVQKSDRPSFAHLFPKAPEALLKPSLTWHKRAVYGDAETPKCATDQTKTLLFVVDTCVDGNHPGFDPNQVTYLEHESKPIISRNAGPAQGAGFGSWSRWLSSVLPTSWIITEGNVTHDIVEAGDHGTFVASLIADRHVGIAPGHEIISVPLPPVVPDYQTLVRALEKVHGYLKARREAGESTRAIINLSLVGRPLSSLHDILDKLLEFPIVIIGAGGNVPIAARLQFPGSHPGVLLVGAVDHRYEEADFSSFGHRIDVFAPGVAVCGARANYTGYRVSDGTSYAAPLVCGIALQALSHNPRLTTGSLKDMIKGSQYVEASKVSLCKDADLERRKTRISEAAPPFVHLMKTIGT